MTDSLSNKTTTKSRKPLWVLLILLALFAVPLLLAWFSTTENDSLGQGTTNHGQLLQPPLALSKLDLRDNQGQNIQPALWRGRWLLLYVNPTPTCTEACAKTLYYLRQIRTATGKYSDRVQRGILTFTHSAPDPKLMQLLQADYNGTLHLFTSSDAFTQFIHNTADEQSVLQQGGTYVVDPLGNVLMVYQLNSDPMGIYKDLMRLLKISHIG